MSGSVSTSLRISLIVLFMIAGCRSATTEKRRTEILMGTEVEVIVRGGRPAVLSHAIDAAFAEMRKVEAGMSRYDPGSELSRINAMAGAGEIQVSPGMMSVLRAARRAHDLTGGAFDPSVGPAIRLWSRTPPRLPSAEEITSIRGLVNFNIVKFSTNRTIRLPAGMALDLDGIAKGYAVDRALNAVRRLGISSALVDAGGDLACYSSGKEPWAVGIRDPYHLGPRPILVLHITNGALCTSGGAERYWEIAGKRYPRIIDPAALMPPAEPPLSGSAFADSATDADAWATASVVLGKRILSAGGKSAPALAIYTGEKVFIVNDRWKELFGQPVSP